MIREAIINAITRIRCIPLGLLLIIAMLLACGLFVMRAASFDNPTAIYFNKQLIYATVFFFMMILIAVLDLKLIFKMSYSLYAISLILLIGVTIVGHTAMGATRWLDLGFVKMQPSEIMKLTLVLALARYFHFRESEDLKGFKNLIVPIALTAIPLIIILKQPNLGMAVTLLCVSLIIFFLSGIPLSRFVTVFGLIAISCPIIWKYLHAYQKKRILVFLNPESDPLGSGYNIIQSKIAIGSGGLLGKGMSTQANLDFLPEHQTDFVFSLFAESFGFVGSLVLILCFLMIIFLGTYYALKARHRFGKLLIFGLTSVFSVNVMVNLGVVTGLLPVGGIPLPFLSYGGSSLATTLILFGIIMNVAINYKSTISNNG